MGSWDSKYDKYVGHYVALQDLSNLDVEPKDAIKVIDADFGRKLGFARVAVHHITLPPQCRTSMPHAESLEEEFVYVLSGRPDIWIDGHLYRLKEGHAVGFPAGTGVAHTFLNNTDTDIHLLVAGERTKKENRCVFPINPEVKDSCGIWWEDAPKRPLGPHTGLPAPGKLVDLEEGALPDCVVFCPDVEKGKAFHYPGDNETFGDGFRISDKVGLKALGIWYERLAPGRRSAFPHAHTHEEEFVYVIQGQPTIWLDGHTRHLERDHFAAFPSNTGIAHTIINDTDKPIIFLCIGETQEFPDEKIVYPLNPLRKRECERKGWYWNDHPKPLFGSHSGRPREPLPEHLSLAPCEEEDAERVFDIFKASPSYFQKVDGCEPSLETVSRPR